MILSILYLPVSEKFDMFTGAGAEYIGFESEYRVNDDTTVAEQSAVAMATYNDAIYLVWHDLRNGDFDIYFSKSTDGGATWGDGVDNGNDVRVDDTDRNLNNTDNETEQKYPDIAVDSSGDIYVVWQDDREGRSDDDIYFAVSADGGATFGPSARVDHNGTGGFDQSMPCIALDNSDNIYIAWEDERNGLNDFDIYFTNSSDGGASFRSPDVLVDDDTGVSLQQNPKIAVKETGGVPELYLVWQDERLGTTDFEVMFSRSTDGGATWGDGLDNNNDKRVNDVTTFVQEHPSIAIDGNGDIVVVWDDERQGGWKDLYISRSSDSGDTWSTNVKLYDSQSNTTDQTHPVIATSNDDMVIAWLDTRNGETQTDIYFTISNDNGATFSQFMQADSGPENTQQSDCAIFMKDPKTVYLAWEDNRNSSRGRDIMFAKSGLIELLAPTLSLPLFTPATGSSSQEFHFTVVYTDLDEDPPAPGFPKLYMFKDVNGTVPYPGSPFEMNKQEVPAQDVLFNNGMIYEDRITLDGEFNFTFYIVARAATGNTSFIMTNLTKGPVIDMSNVTFSDPFPGEDVWHDHINITFGITITDVGAAGIDPLSVKYRMSTNGTTNFGDYAISAAFKYEWFGDSLKVSLMKFFGEGEDNYVQWQASDKFGNGPLESPVYNIKVDTESVSYSNAVPDPAKNYWHNTELVQVGITVADSGVGVDGSTIEYSYSTTGTKGYGPWTSAGLEGSSAQFAVKANITFINGTNNYVRWRAYDALGNGPKESDDYRIRIDTTLGKPGENNPPSAPVNVEPTSTADRTPYITWDESTDADGDEISYWIQIGTSINGSEFLSWTNLKGDLSYRVTKNFDVGTYYVHLKAYDGRDFSDVTISKLEITSGGNHPPGPPTSLTPLFSSESRPMISWSGASDEDGDALTYYIMMGTGVAGSDDILPMTWVGYQSSYEYLGTPLAHGLYHITILVYDGYDWSEPGEFVMKIAYYEVEITAQSPVTIPLAQSKSIKVNVTNKGNSDDTITLNYSAAMEGNANLSFNTNNIKLSPEATISADLKITVLPDAEVRDYYLKITATSEDGTAVAEVSVIVTVKDPSVKPPPGGNGDGDGDDDELGYPWLPNFLKGTFFWLVIIMIIILVGVAVALSSSRKRKRREKEEEARRKRDSYDDVYGAGAPPPPPPAPAPEQQYYDQYGTALPPAEPGYYEEQAALPPAPPPPTGFEQPQQYPGEVYEEQPVYQEPPVEQPVQTGPAPDQSELQAVEQQPEQDAAEPGAVAGPTEADQDAQEQEELEEE